MGFRSRGRTEADRTAHTSRNGRMRALAVDLTFRTGRRRSPSGRTTPATWEQLFQERSVRRVRGPTTTKWLLGWRATSPSPRRAIEPRSAAMTRGRASRPVRLGRRSSSVMEAGLPFVKKLGSESAGNQAVVMQVEGAGAMRIRSVAGVARPGRVPAAQRVRSGRRDREKKHCHRASPLRLPGKQSPS